ARQFLGARDKFVVKHNIGSHINLFHVYKNRYLCVLYTSSEDLIGFREANLSGLYWNQNGTAMHPQSHFDFQHCRTSEIKLPSQTLSWLHEPAARFLRGLR